MATYRFKTPYDPATKDTWTISVVVRNEESPTTSTKTGTVAIMFEPTSNMTRHDASTYDGTSLDIHNIPDPASNYKVYGIRGYVKRTQTTITVILPDNIITFSALRQDTNIQCEPTFKVNATADLIYEFGVRYINLTQIKYLGNSSNLQAAATVINVVPLPEAMITSNPDIVFANDNIIWHTVANNV